MRSPSMIVGLTRKSAQSSRNDDPPTGGTASCDSSRLYSIRPNVLSRRGAVVHESIGGCLPVAHRAVPLIPVPAGSRAPASRHPPKSRRPIIVPQNAARGLHSGGAVFRGQSHRRTGRWAEGYAGAPTWPMPCVGGSVRSATCDANVAGGGDRDSFCRPKTGGTNEGLSHHSGDSESTIVASAEGSRDCPG